MTARHLDRLALGSDVPAVHATKWLARLVYIVRVIAGTGRMSA